MKVIALVGWLQQRSCKNAAPKSTKRTSEQRPFEATNLRLEGKGEAMNPVSEEDEIKRLTRQYE